MEFSSEQLPSERRFGLFFSLVFSCVATYTYLSEQLVTSLALFLVAALFLVLAICFPRMLRVLNILWFRLGVVMGTVVSPLVLALIFFGIFTPIALIMKLKGRDELRLKFRSASSYWRIYSSDKSVSFKQQF